MPSEQELLTLFCLLSMSCKAKCENHNFATSFHIPSQLVADMCVSGFISSPKICQRDIHKNFNRTLWNGAKITEGHCVIGKPTYCDSRLSTYFVSGSSMMRVFDEVDELSMYLGVDQDLYDIDDKEPVLRTSSSDDRDFLSKLPEGIPTSSKRTDELSQTIVEMADRKASVMTHAGGEDGKQRTVDDLLKRLQPTGHDQQDGVLNEMDKRDSVRKSQRIFNDMNNLGGGDECVSRQTCYSCLANDSCAWKTGEKTCVEKSLFTFWGAVTDHSDCPCRKCQQWYAEEKKNTQWLNNLNSEIPCPCKTRTELFSLVPLDQSSEDWSIDWSCPGGKLSFISFCYAFHPGASGCIRSSKTTSAGARQQCCYDAGGSLIPPGTLAAGTPDKGSNYFQHQIDDVRTFKWCCWECEEGSSYCDYYINDVRKGSNSHCTP